jgi:hypothetical protein
MDSKESYDPTHSQFDKLRHGDGHNGSFTGYGADAYGLGGSDTQITVVNDTAADLKLGSGLRFLRFQRGLKINIMRMAESNTRKTYVMVTLIVVTAMTTRGG